MSTPFRRHNGTFPRRYEGDAKRPIGRGKAPRAALESASLRELLSPFFAEEEFSRTPFVSLRTRLGQTTTSGLFNESATAESFLGGLLGDDDGPRSAVFRVELLDMKGLSASLASALADAKEKVFDGAWTAHIYISSSGAAALGNHTDVTDVVVWQLAGRKQWLRCAPNDDDLEDDLRRKRDKCATYSGMWFLDLFCRKRLQVARWPP